MKTISQAEKTDILLALAMAFEKKNAEIENRESFKTVRELAADTFAALNPEEAESIELRAGLLDNLTGENRETWREIRLEKIRGRGLAKRLDAHLNPSHIVEILSREPPTIQRLILKNLPPDLSRRISL